MTSSGCVSLRVLSLLVATLGAGCAADLSNDDAQPNGDEGVTLATTSQALIAEPPYEIRTETPAHIMMAPVSTHTCYLTGVYGSMNYGPVRIVTHAGSPSWWFEVIPPSYGRKIGGTAVCVKTVANRTAQVHSSGPDTLLGAATPKRQCFLTGVNADSYVASYGASNDQIRTFVRDGNWYLGGSGETGATASCIDVGGFEGAWEYGSSAPLTQNLMEDLPGLQCFMSAIGGRYVTNSFTAFSAVRKNSLTGWWQIRTSGDNGDPLGGGKRVGTRCVK